MHRRAFVLVVAGLATASCHLQRPWTPLNPGHERDPVQQRAARAHISACGRLGSGVIVGKQMVLTAHHVTGECSTIYVTAQGKTRAAKVARLDPAADVVLLEVSDVAYARATATIAPPPMLGRWVCLVPTVPTADRRCGLRQRGDDGWRLKFTAITQEGNSGAGIYDSHGRLVAIVTHLYRCSNGQICGGMGTPLHQRSWLLSRAPHLNSR